MTPRRGAPARAVRRSLRLSRAGLWDELKIGTASLARYELGDAPLWMPYALIGVGVLSCGGRSTR